MFDANMLFSVCQSETIRLSPGCEGRSGRRSTPFCARGFSQNRNLGEQPMCCGWSDINALAHNFAFYRPHCASLTLDPSPMALHFSSVAVPVASLLSRVLPLVFFLILQTTCISRARVKIMALTGANRIWKRPFGRDRSSLPWQEHVCIGRGGWREALRRRKGHQT